MRNRALESSTVNNVKSLSRQKVRSGTTWKVHMQLAVFKTLNVITVKKVSSTKFPGRDTLNFTSKNLITATCVKKIPSEVLSHSALQESSQVS